MSGNEERIDEERAAVNAAVAADRVADTAVGVTAIVTGGTAGIACTLPSLTAVDEAAVALGAVAIAPTAAAAGTGERLESEDNYSHFGH